MNIINTITSDNFNKTIFDNGLSVVSEFVPSINSFSAGICVNIGSRNDWRGKEGIAHFMEHSAFRHTQNRNSKQIANAFENLGAYSNAFTTKELTFFYVRAITQHFVKTFELLADITMNTIFIEKEIEKEKLIILEEIKSYEDDPEEYICDLADTLVFAGTPLAPPIIGFQNSVTDIKYTDLRDFHSKLYQPQNITIAVAGNIEHSAIIDAVSKYFPDVQNERNIETAPTIQPIPIPYLSVNKDIQQAHLMLSTNTKGIRNDERYCLAVANVMFGEGMSSRLYQNLREKHGLAYSIYSSIQNYIDCGAWSIYVATDEKKVGQTIELILKEMEKFRETKKPTMREIERAKEQLKTATIIELESMSSRMQNLIKQEVSIGKYETIPEIIASIDSITLEDVSALATTYFNPTLWCRCLLLPDSE
ncbi:MAG: insulinase family protein [Ignavibacteria bacterium]|jgi:predicted Zn-dependent peptidase|nr:insulinase family protein [Ignavibacteria bacterium]